MALTDDDLEKQAQDMAEKALPASLAESARKAKLPAVKQKILERLKAQRDERAKGPNSLALAVGQATTGPAGSGPGMAPPPPTGAAPPPPPPSAPPPPPQPVEEISAPKVNGIELCGDEPWFADISVRRRLRESVAEAHKEQKILVGAPADEVVRICPEDGRTLGAGAVLRLGGAHLGGYGESDVAYAYRQLSRALHPDKNPDLSQAPAAFHRLSEAAEELRKGLEDQRAALQTLVGAMGGQATQQMLERPQEALFAEACRVLSAICGIVGEGEVNGSAQSRAMMAFSRSGMYHSCQIPSVLAEWFEKPQLLELYASFSLRTAYDCAPKRFRAQFLCLLNRAAIVEAKRFNDCVRGSWQHIMQTWPELGLWRSLRDRIQGRVWDTSNEPDVPQKRKSRSKHRSRSRSRRRRERSGDRERSRSGGDRRRRRATWGDEADGGGEGGARRQRNSWYERDRGREADYGQERQRDLAWESRWTTSDDVPNHEIFQDKKKERDSQRDRRVAIETNVKTGWKACRWGRKWRWTISSILPSQHDGAAPLTDLDARKLATILWNDIVKWVSGTDTERVLGLFTADHQTPKTFGWDVKAEQPVPRGLEPGTPPAEWSFVPVADLLLVVGEGLVGITAEGMFAENPAGHKRLTLAQCYKRPEQRRSRRGDGDDGKCSNGEKDGENSHPGVANGCEVVPSGASDMARKNASKWDVQG